MKATELRIGNIVRCNDDGTIFKIDEITAMGLTVTVLGGGETTWIEFDQFEPILLTEKWLTGLGYLKHGGEGKEWFANRSSSIVVFSKHYGRFAFQLGVGHDRILESVHELQNIHFAVYGRELTLKPPTP